MTHRYSLLVGGTILPALGEPSCSAIAWAEGTVLLIGTDDQIRAISRGDSEVFDLLGSFVVPLGDEDVVTWPPVATLEVGGPANLAILPGDPRRTESSSSPTAILRGGHVVRGRLPSEPERGFS